MTAIPDLNPLAERYGYVPSFHDAHIVEIRSEGTQLLLTLYVYEKPAEGHAKQDWDNDLHTVCTLSFSDVQEVQVTMTDNWLHKAHIEQTSDGVCFCMIDQESGKPGYIRAARCTVHSLEEPDERFHWRGENINSVQLNLRF